MPPVLGPPQRTREGLPREPCVPVCGGLEWTEGSPRAWVGGTRQASRRELTGVERTLVGWSEREGKGPLPIPAMGLKVASKRCAQCGGSSILLCTFMSAGHGSPSKSKEKKTKKKKEAAPPSSSCVDVHTSPGLGSRSPRHWDAGRAPSLTTSSETNDSWRIPHRQPRLWPSHVVMLLPQALAKILS